MADTDLDRRTLLKLLGGCTAAGLTACGRRETSREGLVRLLELAGDEERWVDALSATEQDELHRLLMGRESSEVDPRATVLLTKLLAPRSRLFGFVRYPVVADRRTVCDGLIRE